MPSITCTHCGATLKTANPVAAGKKVTCPKCKKAFVVEDAEEPEDQEAGDEEETPAAKKSAKKGDAEPAKSNVMLFALIGGGLAVLFLCCAGSGITAFLVRDKLGFGSTTVADAKDKEKDKEKQKDKDGPGPVVEAKPDFTMTAQEIADDFFKDPKTNDKKYFNKTCDITGEVAQVRWAFLGTELILRGINKGGNFNLRTVLKPEQEAMAHRFSRGQRIKMVAKMSGHNLSGNQGYVDFRDSVLTEIDKSTLIETRADTIAAEFEQNANQATAKYNGKEVIVTGIVESVKDRPAGNAEVRLKGTAKLAIIGLLDGNDKNRVTVGQPLDLRGDWIIPPFPGGGQIRVINSLVAAKKK